MMSNSSLLLPEASLGAINGARSTRKKWPRAHSAWLLCSGYLAGAVTRARAELWREPSVALAVRIFASALVAHARLILAMSCCILASLTPRLALLGCVVGRQTAVSRARVFLLLAASRPLAVVLAVRTVIVDSLKRQGRVRTSPHVFNEGSERVKPPIRHVYSAPAIPRKRLRPWIHAPLNHRLPDRVFAVVRAEQAMRSLEWHAPFCHESGAI